LSLFTTKTINCKKYFCSRFSVNCSIFQKVILHRPLQFNSELSSQILQRRSNSEARWRVHDSSERKPNNGEFFASLRTKLYKIIWSLHQRRTRFEI